MKDKDVNRDKWKLFISQNKFATPFQSVEYYDFINSVPKQVAKVFAIEINDILQALCVVVFQREKGTKGYFSRRAIINGGPLLIDGEAGKLALAHLMNFINITIKGKVIYGEIRNLVDYHNYKECFLTNNWYYEPHLNVQIQIKNKSREAILRSMKYQRRREVSLSIKSGVITKQANNQNEIQKLYLILKNLYKVRVKSPLPTLDFFLKLYLSEVGKVFLVIHDNQIIGGTFCIYNMDLSVNTIYYCGLRNYHRNIFPTTMAVMAAIEFGINYEMKLVDLMGAGKPDAEYGVRNYKIEFGGELVEHGRFKNIYSPFLFRLGTIGLELLNRLRK
ncbi:MAG: hypothetical protein ACOYNC_13735 [Bacteroidales bacterium]